MPDLGKTDAEWLDVAAAQGFGLRISRALEDFARRFDRKRTQLVPHMSLLVLDWPSANNTLTGVNYGTNTDENGDLWLRITGASPTATVSLYSASGATGLVAEATGNVSNGGVATLTAQNSSGLSGTLQMPATIVTVTDDSARIRVLQDFTLETLDLWDDSGEDDGKSRAAAERLLTSMANGLRSLQAGAVATFMQELAISAPDNPKPQVKAFLESSETQLFGEVEENDGSNNISRTEVGVWALQKQAMADETTGSTQDILERVVARGAGVFDTNNDGQGAVTSGTAEDRARIGKFTLECATGLGNGGGGTETFTGKFVATDSDFERTFTGLEIKKSYALPFGGGTITLTRTISKTGDASDLDVGDQTTFSFTGENESNTDAGVIYGRVNANASNWDYSFYSDSGRTDKVAEALNVAASATSVTASATNGSGLTIVFDAGSAPTDTNTWSTDCNFFSVNNSVNQKDRFSVTTTLTSSGATARVLAEVWNAEWNGINTGEQLDDGPLAIQGVFADRMKDDI